MLSETLNRREEEVMNAVFTLSGGKERFLCSAAEILALLPAKGFDEEILLRILATLEMDGYFELISSDRKGERMLVVHMKEAGLSFRRSNSRRKRTLIMRVCITLALAVLSAVVGVVLKAVFS